MKYIAIMLMTIMMLLLSGCMTGIGDFLTDKEPVTEPKEVQINNPDGTVTKSTIEVPALDAQGAPVYKYTKSSGVEFAETVAQNSGVPWAGTIVGTLSTVGLALLNNRERRRRKDTDAELIDAKNVTHALIGGVQTLIDSPEGKVLVNEGKSLIKQKIGDFANYAGVKELLDKEVKFVTTS